MQQVDTVMGAVHRERLSVRTDGGSCPMPAWADWLIWLGAWLRSQAALSGRRVTVVLLPTRRLAAAFVGLGRAGGLAPPRRHTRLGGAASATCRYVGSLARPEGEKWSGSQLFRHS